MGWDKLLKKDWKPKFGFSRRDDEAYVKFASFDGTTSTRKKFGLVGKYFSFGAASIKNAVQTLTSTSNAVAVNAALGNIWNHLLTENTTISAPSNLTAGTVYKLILTQAAAANRTVAFNAVFKLKGNWVKNPAYDSVDVLTFYTDGTSLFEISAREIAYGPLLHQVLAPTSTTNAVAINAALGDVWNHLLTESTTLSAPSNLRAGTIYTLVLTQAAAANYTVAFNAVFKLKGPWVKNAAYDSVDVLTFYSDGTSLFEISASEIAYGPIVHQVLAPTSTSNAMAIDAALGDIWNHLLTENTTLSAPSNLKAGTIYTLILTQAAAANYTVAFNAVFKLKGSWVKNAAYDTVDTLKFYSDGTSLFQISASSPAYAPLQRAKVTLTSDSAHVAIDAALGDYWYHLTTEDTELDAPTNLKAGARYTLHLLQGGTARTLAFNAVFKLVGSAFTITATQDKTDMLEFISDGTALWETSRGQDLG